MSDSIHILLINDDAEMLSHLKDKIIVDMGCHVSSAPSSRAGLDLFRENEFGIVVARFDMPDLSGIELIKGLKKINPDSVIILLLEEPEPNLLDEINMLGVYDCVNKPINLDKLLFLIQKGIGLYSLNVGHRRLIRILQEQNTFLQKQNVLLVKRVEESTKNLTKLYEDLRQTYMHTIKVLAQAIDARDHYTHSHSEDVARYATIIAEEMRLSANEIELIRDACELHDLGKIGIEDAILSKASELTASEWSQIKRHPLIGAQILEPLNFLRGVTDLVKQHHEHYDGTGYPYGLKGDNILLGARIIHVADAYEAMRSPRSYRKIPLSKEDIIEEIKKNSGTQFDPKVVEAFLSVVDRL